MGVLSSAEMQSVNSTAPTDKAVETVGWLDFMAYQFLMGYFMPNFVYVYKSKMSRQKERIVSIYIYIYI